jgi:hypothetical protein
VIHGKVTINIQYATVRPILPKHVQELFRYSLLDTTHSQEQLDNVHSVHLTRKVQWCPSIGVLSIQVSVILNYDFCSAQIIPDATL